MLSVCKEDSIQITVGNISKSAYSVRKKWSRDFELGFALKLKDERGKRLKLKTVKNKGNIIGDVVCSCVSG